MKRKLLLFVALFIATTTFANDVYKQKLDSVYFYLKTSETDSIVWNKMYYTYSSDYEKTSIVLYTYNGDNEEFELSDSSYYILNDQNLIIEGSSLYLENDSLIGDKEVNDYDSEGNIISSFFSDYKLGAFKENSRTLYTYDDNNRLLNKEESIKSGSDWLKNDDYFYNWNSTYDTLLIYNIIEDTISTVKEIYNEDSFLIYIEENSSYSKEKKIIIRDEFNNILTDSVFIYRKEIDVNTSEAYFILNSIDVEVIQYDDFNQVIETSIYSYLDSSWISDNKESYHFDYGVSTDSILMDRSEMDVKFKIQSLTYDYGIDGINDFTGVCFYSDIEDIVTNTNRVSQDSQLSIFPNPTANVIYFNKTINNGLVNVFDLDGRLVKSTNLSNQNSLNLSNLNEGIYILNLIEENKQTNFRIIKN